MTKIIITFPLFIAIIILNSCTIENRLYLSGKNLNWKLNRSFQESNIIKNNQNIEASIQNTFSEDFKKISEKSNIKAIKFDTLYFITGKKITVSILTVDSIFIKYKVKNDLLNRIFKVNKTKVAYIKSHNNETISYPFYQNKYPINTDSNNIRACCDLIVYNTGRKKIVRNSKIDSLNIYYNVLKFKHKKGVTKKSTVSYIIRNNGEKTTFTSNNSKKTNIDQKIKEFDRRKKHLSVLLPLVAIAIFVFVLVNAVVQRGTTGTGRYF
jgi:hypothetical protein